MSAPRVEASPWAASRRRAEALRDRHDFAAQMLTLYLALVGVWEQAWTAAREEGVRPEGLPAWAARRVLPLVVAKTNESGPRPLAQSLSPDPSADAGAATELMAAWLAGAELVPVERYLAVAALRGPLQAVDAGAACAADPQAHQPRGGRRCPDCGGPPLCSYRTDTGDHLVSGHRRLMCLRCGGSWAFSGSACPGCDGTGGTGVGGPGAGGNGAGGSGAGENGAGGDGAAGARRTVYAERREGPRVGRGEPAGTLLGHLRAESCSGCRRYLIDVDLGREPRAVPEVDELVALPLDLYAAERGLSKITPNVMGM